MFKFVLKKQSINSYNGKLIRNLFNINNNVPKELPSFIPILIRENVEIKDPLKRIEVKTPTNITKDVFMPSFNFNKTQIIEKILPTTKINEENYKIASYYRHGFVKNKFSFHLIRIKRRGMKKHHLRKWRKKYLSVILNKAKIREIRKEKSFRAELLTQIKTAENFDAKNYVNGVLETILKDKNVKKEKSLDVLFDLIRKHKFETTLVRPKFDDPVPKDFDKLE